MEETTPSAREMDVLKVLWKLGEASVREVRQVLCPNEECAFTTVQTLLRIMTEKGLVAQRAKGRTMYYKAKYTSQRGLAILAQSVRRFVRTTRAQHAAKRKNLGGRASENGTHDRRRATPETKTITWRCLTCCGSTLHSTGS